MQNNELISNEVFCKTVLINASTAEVWEALTNTTLMKEWMSEQTLDIITDWKVGNAITISGQLYKKPFVNNGTILAFEQEQKLHYTHLSSLSKLPDAEEHYAHLLFELEKVNDKTALTLTISNFATEAIYKHLAFYWNVTLELFKKHVEQSN